MGKPKAPTPPDYAAAATAQGQANTNSAIATNSLNQVNQIGPYGSLTYNHDGQGTTLPDGTVIPGTTATTTLSPEQQKLYDQNIGLSTSLNDIAAKGLNYVDQYSNQPVDLSQLPAMGKAPNLSDFNSTRDSVTQALMDRLQPQLDRQRSMLDSKLANQGIPLGSKAYATANSLQGQQENDARTQALLAGTDQANTMYGQGLASAQFSDQARAQALQEQDYARNAPLNMLNNLRTGNQATVPQFGAAPGTGATIGAAPVYAATNDAYNGALQQYQQQNQQFSSLMGGLGSIGGAAITAFSDRRLKQNIQAIGRAANGLMLYSYSYLWSKVPEIGHMADEVERLFPDAVGWFKGFAYVDYRKVATNG